MSVRILEGDALTVLKTLDAQTVQCCVTSPPYFGLRDYGVVGQLGLEKTPQLYVDAMVGVFSEVKRVLRDDGTLWLNLGDSYSARAGQRKTTDRAGIKQQSNVASVNAPSRCVEELGGKQLIGIPWRVALALQESGWTLRLDIVWHKTNAMPESMTDRPTKTHEYLFLMAKSDTYYYDAPSIAEPLQSEPKSWGRHSKKDPGMQAPSPRPIFGPGREGRDGTDWGNGATRNSRSVWSIPTKPYHDAHFATMPPDLARRCVRAGSRRGDLILDPFTGAGTTGLVATVEGRHFVGVELNPKYAAMARERIHSDNPLFGDVA